MERLPPGPREDEEEETPPPSPHPRGLFSCWARLRRALPGWRRLRRRGSGRWRLLRPGSRTPRRPKPGNFRYDPLSYAQNFEDKHAWDGEDGDGDGDDGDDPCSSYRGFSSRFVVITPAPPAPEEQ